MLFLKDWVMKEIHNKSDVKQKLVVMRKFMKRYKQLIQRENNGLKIPKFHEVLHICRDISRHGPTLEFDTCPAESNHRFTKEEGKKTQRIKSRFVSQTATRIYERNVIYTAYDDSQMKNSHLNNKAKNNDDNKLFG